MKRSSSKYDFYLPKSLIATAPASPRDSAQLFVYNTASGKITFDTFQNLSRYLPEKSLLVTNDTKVLPVRIIGKKQTGGRVELFLCINEEAPRGLIRAISNRRLEVGQDIAVGSYRFSVIKKEMSTYLIKPHFPISALPRVLERIGRTPIPPYLKHTSLSETKLRKEYQSILAEHPASVAAPTALLHFTPRLFSTLEKKGIDHTSITLHVGRGTFAPLSEESLRTKKLHKEPYSIPARTTLKIQVAKKNHRPIIAVGTTVTRTLESAAQSKKSSGSTDLFITPGFSFETIDGLITNFHVPKSSLMYLVDAFLQHKHSPQNILELYDIAIRNKFRFYSFGDGMLIL